MRSDIRARSDLLKGFLYSLTGTLLLSTNFVTAKYGLEVMIGTHPIPQNYYLTHQALGTWQSTRWQEQIQHVLTDKQTRLAYD